MRVGFRPVHKVGVSLVHGGAQERDEVVRTVHVVVKGGEVPDGDGRGDVTGGGSAHAVRKNEQVGRSVSCVLIV